MAKKTKRTPSRQKTRSAGQGQRGTKLNRVDPAGNRKGGNPGGTNEAGNRQVQGSSHQGSSLGKRDSG